MTGAQCKNCGGNIYEEINGICYCDTCGYVKYLDGIIINGVNNDNEDIWKDKNYGKESNRNM